MTVSSLIIIIILLLLVFIIIIFIVYVGAFYHCFYFEMSRFTLWHFVQRLNAVSLF